jgi:hypothetical protein
LKKTAGNLLIKTLQYADQKISALLQFLPGAKATDIGEIAYFAVDCPDGWEEYIYS